MRAFLVVRSSSVASEVNFMSVGLTGRAEPSSHKRLRDLLLLRFGKGLFLVLVATGLKVGLFLADDGLDAIQCSASTVVGSMEPSTTVLFPPNILVGVYRKQPTSLLFWKTFLLQKVVEMV
jgi:hypothetical protein